MKTINLLPKKKFAEAWFVPLLGGIIVVSILALIGLTSGTVLLQNQHKKQLEHIDALKTSIQDATAIRQPDPLSIEFEKYKQLVTGLESTQFNWIPVLDTLVAAMPHASRLQSAGYDPSIRNLTLRLDFQSMVDAAAYVGALRSSDKFEEAKVSDLSKQIFIPTAAETQTPAEQPDGSFFNNMNGQAAEASPAPEIDENTRLLEELDAIINGKMVEPQGASDGAATGTETTGALTPKELEQKTYYSLTVVLKVKISNDEQTTAP